MWTNRKGHKKDHYIKEFNPNCDHGEKAYLGAVVKGKAKLLVAQLRTGSHHLRCEIGRWKVPKEEWEERTSVSAIKAWWRQKDTLLWNVQPTRISAFNMRTV